MKKIVFFILLGLNMTLAMHGETASFPGRVSSLSNFNNFFYNLPENDFIYYFNDTLIFSEPPDESIYSDGVREKYLKLDRQHHQIKNFIFSKGNAADGSISLQLKNEDGFKKGIDFFKLLGLELKKDTEGKFQLQAIIDDKSLPLDNFYELKLATLVSQLNSTSIFLFKLPETRLRLPWDFSFLSNITGLKIDQETFFETMIANKRFSLLLAILFRLSDDEIHTNDQSIPKEPGVAWKRFFQDRKLLMGLLVLSNALRVRSGQLFLPGGNQAYEFWKKLVGIDPRQAPFDFIAALASRDSGKLNYLFTFSFYLPEETRKAVFFDYNADKIRRIYEKITLGVNEKIRTDAFPRLENFNYFSLLKALTIKNNKIFFPVDIHAWAKAMGWELPPRADECDFLLELLAHSEKNGSKISIIQKFSSLYAKFADRPWLLTPEILKKLYQDFESKNCLIDFIEKIPLKKPETIEALFTWQEGLLTLKQNDQMLFAALGQSLLEIIAQMAWFAPDRFDYDRMVSDLLAVSWQRPGFFEQIFAFIKIQTGVNSTNEISDEVLLDLVLSGLKNMPLTIQNQSYEWLVKDVFKASLVEILRSQEDCTLSVLAKINTLLDTLCQAPTGFRQRSGNRLIEAFEELPYPDFSKDAPKVICDRVLAYSKTDLDLELQKLLKMSEKKDSQAEIQKTVREMKSVYLLPNLKDFFVTLAYALNAKNQALRLFSNPNMVRLHDFSDDNGGSPWSIGSAPGNKAKFSGYYLKGGLSRLNLTFANIWRNQMFSKNIFNNGHVQATINNIMSMLPLPLASRSPNFDALLVEFAVELLQKCRGDEKLKTEIKNASMNLIAGYHYRKLNEYFSGKSDDYYLFFSELQQIGTYFLKNEARLTEFSQSKQLKDFIQMPLSSVIAQENDLWGNIDYQSSGSLRPHQYSSFPQEIANLFASGWVGGEMIREFKIKAAHLIYKNDFPSPLLGQFIFDYFNSVLKPIYAQNHEKDYFSTYFVIDMMDSGHLKNTLKKMLKEGALRLK